jgi:hypothetical protein
MEINILILDAISGPSLYNPVTYSDFIDKSDCVELLILSNGISQKDKDTALAYKEIKDPTINGLMESIVLEWHQKYRIDVIYTKQEDLIIRAAYLRDKLGLNSGLDSKLAMIYRDKFVMKTKSKFGGFNVPNFRKIKSPIDILEFVNENGLPVIIKPILGQASSGITVLHTKDQLDHYLESDFYACINDKIMDYTGNLMIEDFVPSKMVHVNGYAKNGSIQYFWPFYYHSTNLNFTMGKAYGNIYIPESDPMHVKLRKLTQELIKILKAPENLMFHGELFEISDPITGDISYKLCEIAARRPGGSIGILIDQVLGGKNTFAEIEFRLSIGLNPRQDMKQDANFTCADLIIPLQIGKLISLPAEKDCHLANCLYKPLGKIGTVYKGFNVNNLNTAARFMISTPEKCTINDMESRLSLAATWFNKYVWYEPLNSALDFDRINIKNDTPLKQIERIEQIEQKTIK